MNIVSFAQTKYGKWALGGLAVLLVFVGGYGTGRFAAPKKIEYRQAEAHTEAKKDTTQKVEAKAEAKTKEVFRDRIVYRDRSVITHADGSTEHRDIERTETGTDKKDGDVKTDVKATETSKVDVKTESHSSDKTVTNDAPRLHVNIIAAIDITHIGAPQLLGPISLGAQIEYRIIGPIWVGAFGMSSGVGGVSLGIEF